MQYIPLKISGLENNFRLRVGFKIHDFKSALESFTSKSSLVSYDYLKTIEDFPPNGLRPFYAALYDDQDDAIGFFLFQIKYFKANQSIKFGQDDDLFSRIHLKMRSIVAGLVEFNTLICGNLLLTGSFGYLLQNKYKSHESLMYQFVIEESQGWLRANGYDCNVILVKDFYSFHRILEESTFHAFSIQPNMILDMNSDWTDFSDYLNALHSKYRIRAKRAFKAAEKVSKKELNLDEVIELNDQLYSLYKQTATHAEFNLLDLHQDYFKELKRHLREHVHFFTYYIEGELSAFYTIIIDGNESEAHFLGINEELNRKHQLYLNILFDIIRFSILNNKIRIRFSRTAIEIKSSVGARPYAMTCYIKHRRVINNTFVPYVLDFLNQKQDYVIRHPFKESEEVSVDLINN